MLWFSLHPYPPTPSKHIDTMVTSMDHKKNGFLINKLLQAIMHNTYSECILAFPKLLVEIAYMIIYDQIMALQLD
jgi:hypothetical protein